jgi:hypothetical protein
VIPSMLIKDRIVIGPRSVLNAASHLASQISRFDHEA